METTEEAESITQEKTLTPCPSTRRRAPLHIHGRNPRGPSITIDFNTSSEYPPQPSTRWVVKLMARSPGLTDAASCLRSAPLTWVIREAGLFQKISAIQDLPSGFLLAIRQFTCVLRVIKIKMGSYPEPYASTLSLSTNAVLDPATCRYFRWFL